MGRLARRFGLPLVVAVALVIALVAPLRHGISSAASSVKSSITGLVNQQVEDVLAVSATATTSLPGHPADLLIDGNASSYWATAPSATSGTGQAITVRFGANGPTDVDYVIFTIGAQAPDNFAYQPRPSELLLVFNSDQTRTIHLQDTAKPQKFKVSAKAVRVMVAQIEQVYPGSSGTSCAIAEIEFRKIKH